jgi:preprotein translocase subunit SecF
MEKKKWAFVFSLILILIGLISLLMKGGPNYGIDFAGGSLIQVKFNREVFPSEIKRGLKKINLGDTLVQRFGKKGDNEYLIRVEKSIFELKSLSKMIERSLQETFGKDCFEIRRAEMVGPKVGGDLRRKGILAIFYAMGGILIYITWRFEFRFATGAILALIHDVIITVGAFSVTNREFSLPIVAAILTIVGYSLNDTIVVYDRIRENSRKMREKSYQVIINSSINETLSRTILTSATTLLVVLALFIFGGGVIHNFAFALLVGIIIGTYSSIFVASPILIIWEEKFSKKKIKR